MQVIQHVWKHDGASGAMRVNIARESRNTGVRFPMNMNQKEATWTTCEDHGEPSVPVGPNVPRLMPWQRPCKRAKGNMRFSEVFLDNFWRVLQQNIQ